MGGMEPTVLSFTSSSLFSGTNEGPVSVDRRVHVGDEYQVDPPRMLPLSTLPEYQETPDKCQRVWSPTMTQLTDEQIDTYLSEVLAINKNFTEEQALSMLSFHNFDTDSATEDLKKCRPVEKRWCDNDRIPFENAFNLHGKNFPKLQQAVPHKSLSEVIAFYYAWKKPKIKTAVMDMFVEQMKLKRDCNLSWWESEDYEFLAAFKKRKVCGNSYTTHLPEDSTDLPCAGTSMFDLTKYSSMLASRKAADLIHLEDDDVESTTTSIHTNTQSNSTGNSTPNTFSSLPPNMTLTLGQLQDLVELIPRWEESKFKLTKATEQLKARMQVVKREAHEETGKLAQPKLNYKDCRRLYSQMLNTSKTPSWSKSEELICVFAIQKYGLKRLNAIAAIVGSKTVGQIQEFIHHAQIRYRLSDLLDPNKLQFHALGNVVMQDKNKREFETSKSSGGITVATPTLAGQTSSVPTPALTFPACQINGIAPKNEMNPSLVALRESIAESIMNGYKNSPTCVQSSSLNGSNTSNLQSTVSSGDKRRPAVAYQGRTVNDDDDDIIEIFPGNS